MAGSRDRYFDTLRTVAIVRVVAYHAFHFAALALVFPSMGVMFALGGSLMASSLDRAGAKAIKSRLRRLLPALWVMGLILVPMMLAGHWAHRPAWPRLLLWVLPLATPPAGHDVGDIGAEGAGVLWYLATYLWLVTLSPLLLRVYRRRPLITLAATPIALLVLPTQPFAHGNAITHTLGNVLIFLPCWVLGFAHRDGDLQRVPSKVVALLAVAGCAVSLGWVIQHHGLASIDLVPHPLAHSLYSMGFVLALLRWTPRMSWLARFKPLDTFVTAVNSRAVTIYLWHNVMITLAIIIGDRPHLWQLHGAFIYLGFSAIAMALIGITVLALGWVEDVAAKRKPRILPWPASRSAGLSRPTDDKAIAGDPAFREQVLDIAAEGATAPVPATATTITSSGNRNPANAHRGRDQTQDESFRAAFDFRAANAQL
jgi:peptidoglycan/LPS O-acetylase OafA/YrhL